MTPKEIVQRVAKKSMCNVQVGAVIVCSDQIISKGFNHLGFDGRGLCAEREAIRRARGRAKNSTLYVAGQWRKSGNFVNSFPCEECLKKMKESGVKEVVWRKKDGSWGHLALGR